MKNFFRKIFSKFDFWDNKNTLLIYFQAILNKLNTFDEKKTSIIQYLLIIYFCFSLFRFIVSLAHLEPIIMDDELRYKSMAYSFFKTGDFYKLKINSNEMQTSVKNFIYPLVISISFYFQDNFYVFIKLINCFLINLIIFPSYMIMREFASVRKALLAATLVLLLPFMNISSFVMTESLFFPLFLFCFLFTYKFFISYRLKYVILTGFLFAILFLTKPTAAAFLISFLFVSFIKFLFPCEKIGGRKKILFYTFLIMAIFILTVILLNFFFLNSVGDIFGVYEQHLQVNPENSEFSDMGLITITAVHFSLIGFLYLVPFFILIIVLFKSIRDKKVEDFTFSLLILCLFFSFIIMVIKGTVDWKFSGESLRVITRHYFVIYPLFIFTFIIFNDRIKWIPAGKVILFFSALLTFLINIFTFLPSLGNYLASDNMDYSCFLILPQTLLILIFILNFLIILYYLLPIKKSIYPYLLFFIIFSIYSNVGQIKLSTQISQLVNKQLHSYCYFIHDNVPDFDTKVAMFCTLDSFSLMTEAAFWLPYNYIKADILPENTLIEKKMLPEDTEYIFLLDKFDPDFKLTDSKNKGNCKIIRDIKVYEWGKEIYLDRCSISTFYKQSGWSHTEEPFWTDGKKSDLSLLINKTGSDLILSVNLYPFLAEGKLDKQRINIYINNKKAGNWIADYTGDYKIIIPEDYITNTNNILKITFELPDAASPETLGISDDERTMAFRLNSLKLEPVPSYHPGTDINFGKNGNFIMYQGNGWSSTEENSTWTGSKRAELALSVDEISSDIVMKAVLDPLIISGKLEKQRVNIYINNRKAGNWIVTSPGVYQITIPEDYIKKSPLNITFDLPDAISQKNLGINEDPRVLALRIMSLILFIPEQEKYELGKDIYFGSGGNAIFYQGTGWSYPEQGLTWTEGKKSDLLLPIARVSSDLTIKFDLKPFIISGIDKQRVNIYANDIQIDSRTISTPGFYEATIPESCINSNFLKITFECPDAISPLKLGLSTDIRNIALGFRSITLLDKPYYQFGKDIQFGRGGNAIIYQKKGWSYPEEGITWTDGERAELSLCIAPVKADLIMKATLEPLIIPGKSDRQRVNIYVNNKKVGDWVVESSGEYKIIIPEEYMENPDINIAFELPDAVSPKSLEAGDDLRVLGLKMEAIKLEVSK